MRILRAVLACLLGALTTEWVGAEPAAAGHAGSASGTIPRYETGLASSADRSDPAPTGVHQNGAGQPDPAASQAQPTLEPAAALFQEAEAKYDAGDLASALGLMEESYRLSGNPELLFNLGQLERELKRCRTALGRYRQYLEQAPAGQRRADASRAVEELVRECPDPPVPQPYQALPKRSYWTTPRVAGWTAILAGVVAGSGALYFQLAAWDKESEMTQIARQSSANREISLEEWSRYQQLDQAGQRDKNYAQILGAVGGGLAVGGALLLVFSASRGDEPLRAVALDLRADGPRAALTGSF